MEVEPNTIIDSGGASVPISSHFGLESFGTLDIFDMPNFECHLLFFILHHNIKVEVSLEQAYEESGKILELGCECPVVVLP